jgi:hypothetical protein
MRSTATIGCEMSFVQKSVVRIGNLLKTVLLNWSDVLPASHHALALVNSPFMFTGILIDY